MLATSTSQLHIHENKNKNSKSEASMIDTSIAADRKMVRMKSEGTHLPQAGEGWIREQTQYFTIRYFAVFVHVCTC